MHQPDYRDINGEFMLPWVYLHAVKDYIDMPLNIIANPGMKANINITPVLIDEWQDYNYRIERALDEMFPNKAAYALPDPFLRPLLLKKLDEDTKLWMSVHYRWANYERTVCRFDNYKRLYDIASSKANLYYLNDCFYFDLCVWFHLAWCGEWMKRYDPVISLLIAKGSGYTLKDRRMLLERLLMWMKYGLTLYGFPGIRGGVAPSSVPEYPDFIEKNKLDELNLKEKGQYFITLSPHYHPIMPLLLDVHSGAIAAQMMDIAYEPVHMDRYEEGDKSARRHMDSLNHYYSQKSGGGNIRALWPSEGAISSESLDIFNEYGINICASGEELLSSSVGMDVHKPVFNRGKDVVPLYRVYAWKDTGLKIIFRDSGLSDLIGFTYGAWRGDDAANDLINKLNSIDDFDKGSIVSVILDGENAWEYYYENGFYFLNDLYSLISSSVKINPLLIDEVLAVCESDTPDNCFKLDGMIPGSWVNGNLRMWVGEGRKNKAWMMLNEAKNEFLDSVNNKKISKKNIEAGFKNLMAAEGSDWFWWLGEDSPLSSQSSMEKIFRNLLEKIYIISGKPVPECISESLSSTKKNIAEIGGIMQRGH